MQFLIVGYGCAGKRHAAILRDMGHEIVSVDPDPAAGADFQLHSGAYLEHDLTWMDYDGILDCTPPAVRAWDIPADCRFVEKPLGRLPFKVKQFETELGKWFGLSLPTPHRMESPTMMGFNYHYAPGLSDFVNEVRKHAVYSVSIVGGQPLQDWHAEDYRAVRQRYRGVVTDSLPHSLYVARWLLGELELVGSVVGKLSELELGEDDVAAALLRSENGVPCYLLTDYLRAPRAFWVEAVTSGGWMRWEFAPRGAREMYVRQMEVFCRVCKGEMVDGYPDFEDGLAVQELLDKIAN
jgi:predicted dehydrogenase